jgi:hypothetical protein
MNKIIGNEIALLDKIISRGHYLCLRLTEGSVGIGKLGK